MSKVYGSNQRLLIQDTIGSDGELEISMAVMSSDDEHTDTWLDKTDAVSIIRHLRKAFGLTD